MQLLFRFDECLEEIRYLKNTAHDLLVDADSILDAFASDLRTIRSKYHAQTSFSWAIKESRPLRTIISRGRYEAGERVGKHHVQADISSIWRIRPMPPRKEKRGLVEQPAEVFTLSGLASVKVKFFDCCKITDARLDNLLGSFRMEVGMPDQPDDLHVSNADFPGCFFHTEVLGEEATFPFPKSLTVPRLPSMIFSPMGVIEFVLGELFQNDWSNNQRHAKSEAVGLAQIQLKRFKNHLQWQHSVVTRNQRRSPWISLKKAHPESTLFSNH